MPLTVVQDAVDGPLMMLWRLLVSLFASLTARSLVNGQDPSGRESLASALCDAPSARFTDLDYLVAPKAFLSIPLGQVKPAGWLHDQVRCMAQHARGV